MKATTIAGHKMVLHPSGALYWPERKRPPRDAFAGFSENGIAVPRKIEVSTKNATVKKRPSHP